SGALTEIGELLEPILEALLGDLVDPLLAPLGIGLGEMDVTVLGVGAACPDLAADKSHTGNFTAAETGLYSIVVSNTGSLATTSPITVVDTLPAGLTYNSHGGNGWTLHDQSGQLLTFIHPGPLAPGDLLPTL